MITKHEGLGRSRNAAKRVADVAVAIAALPAVALAAVVLVPLIRLDSRGPAIFQQRRVGRNEKPILIYKFRTLQTGLREVPTHELDPSSVTRVGRILRATKVDELPQILNVLRGEMSFIGPRPCLPSQLELLEARRNAGVTALLPRISGWAQLAGIDMSTPEWLAAVEREYMLTSTLPDDLRTLVATFLKPARQDFDFDHLRPAD